VFDLVPVYGRKKAERVGPGGSARPRRSAPGASRRSFDGRRGKPR
jgi:hypothetical protein